MGREMERLVREGDNIGSWTGKNGFYKPELLFQKAEELRVQAFQKYHKNTLEGLKEAFVMMMRFAKFYELISQQKGVQKGSAPFQKLQRDLLTVVNVLEELKPRLLKLLNESVAEAPPDLNAEPPKPRDELAIDMAAQLERRWAELQPAKRPEPAPAPPPRPPAPAPVKVAPQPLATLGGAAAAGAVAGAAAGAAVGAAAAGTVGMPGAAGAATSAMASGSSAVAPTVGAAAYPTGTGESGGGGGGSLSGMPDLSDWRGGPVPVLPPSSTPAAPAPPPPPPPPPFPAPPPQPSQPLDGESSLVSPPAHRPVDAPPPPAPPPPPPPAPSQPPPPASQAGEAAAAPAPSPPPPPLLPPDAPANGVAPSSASDGPPPDGPPPSYEYANAFYPKVARPISQLNSPVEAGKRGDVETVTAAAAAAAGVEQRGMRAPASSSSIDGGSDRGAGGGGGAGVAIQPRKRAESGPQDPRSRLTRHLQTRGFKIKDVPGDNNCQFHALADQLQLAGVPGWTALKLRQKAVAWLRDNGDRPMDDGKVGERTLLKDFVGVDNWKSYINEMSQHGRTWGDEATLLAASVLFKAEICVISSLSEDYCHIVTPPDVWGLELRTRLYLGHYHEFHYVSTRPV